MDQGQVHQEEFHYTGSRFEQRRFPPTINFENKPATRVGWVNNDKDKFFCYFRYAEVHTSPQCMLRLRQLYEVVPNYESLYDKERADVQENAYKDAKAYIEFKNKAVQKAAEEGNDTPKN